MSKAMDRLRGIYPELDEQLKREEDMRLIACVTDLYPLLGGWVRPITPAIRARLEMAGSPFLDGRRAMAGDVALFLWLVSPEWIPADRVSIIRTPRAWMHRLRIKLLAKLCNLWLWEAEIRKFMEDQFQDSPGARSDLEDSEGPRVYHQVAGAAFCMREYGMSWGEYMTTPVPVLNQLYRVYQYNHGVGKPLNKSDAMAAELIENEGRV